MFHVSKTRKDGLQSYCKACLLDVNAAAVERNRGAVIKRQATWHQKHQEKQNARSTAWGNENKDARRIHNRNAKARRAATGTLSTDVAKKLMRLQRGKCTCCKVDLGDTGFHLDHIMPLINGGTNTDNNVQLLCPPCNLSKHAKHPIDFMQSRGYLL